MKFLIEITSQQLKQLILKELNERLNVIVDMSAVQIQVKSKKNYRAEWEDAEFRARYEGEVTFGGLDE